MSASISVIMPVHNGAALLDRAVRSVVLQEYLDWELIAVDDESSDESSAVLGDWAEKDHHAQRHLGAGQQTTAGCRRRLAMPPSCSTSPSLHARHARLVYGQGSGTVGGDNHSPLGRRGRVRALESCRGSGPSVRGQSGSRRSIVSSSVRSCISPAHRWCRGELARGGSQTLQ